MYRLLLPLLGAAGLLGGFAQAHEPCHTVEFPLQPTDWSGSLDVPRFDPLTGVLTGIGFSLSASVQGAAGIESLDATPATLATWFQATITLARPDLSPIVVATPLAAFSDDLAAFDGAVDFAGSSGLTRIGLVATAAESSTSTSAADVALFTGAPGDPGFISLPIAALGGSYASGAGNLITQFQTSAGALLTVCYTFKLDCNGNGVPDDDDIGQGTSNDGNHDGIPDECQPGARPFCFGDGATSGGNDCPCGNDGGIGEGCDNGTGSGGLLTASGIPSVSDDTLKLTAAQIPPSQPGLFYFSSQMANGGQGMPFHNGLRCIDFAAPVARVDGGGTIPQRGSPPLSALLGIQPGDTTYFQYWYRNPGGPCGVSGNATNGIELVWGL